MCDVYPGMSKDENKPIPEKQIILQDGILDLLTDIDKINHLYPCLFISISATLPSHKYELTNRLRAFSCRFFKSDNVSYESPKFRGEVNLYILYILLRCRKWEL